RLDTPWHKVQIHGVYTGTVDGTILTGEEIWSELCANNPVLARMVLLHPPRWMRPVADMERDGQVASSVVIALRNEEDAATLLERKTVAAFTRFCEVKRHTDKPPAQQCNKCWGFGHARPYCKGEAKCRLCSGTHEEKDHDVEMGEAARDRLTAVRIKCAQCAGEHVANDRRC
ncbi:hypothetical protein C8J57DRAFT_972668, partial [Mycena rebaudengoi]